MNKEAIKSIIKKDLRGILSSRRTWLPMLLVSTLLCIIMPISFSYLGTYSGAIPNGQADSMKKIIDLMLTHLPKGQMRSELLNLKNPGQQFVFFYLNFMFISIFLMVTVINSMVTSTNSFVREKERGTLETLLFSPITIKELFIAKALASFIPSISITYVAYIISFSAVNLMNYHVYKVIFMFNIMWVILMFWMIPAVVLFNILLNILISAKVKTFQEAQQLGGLLVLPVVGFVVTQSTGLFLINPTILLFIGVVLYIIDIILLAIVIKLNKRDSLFENQIH